MACISLDNPVKVSVPSFEVSQEEKITLYVIIIKIGSIFWTVNRRYSSFVDLHESLVTNHGLGKDLLPPKKFIGNKNPTFIERRRADLELYLQTIVEFLSVAVPEELGEFLELKNYEIKYLLHCLAKHFFLEGEKILGEETPLVFNPLELMAISQQLKMPHSHLFSSDIRSDFTNIVDICSSIKYLIIEGSSNPYKASNLILNDLSYSLGIFKNLKRLRILNSSVSKIEKLGNIRMTLDSLVVNDSKLSKVNDILFCDSFHKNNCENSDYIWPKLVDIDLSSNSIEELDKSIIMVPNLRNLDLKSNNFVDIGCYLTKLPHLVNLCLSNNKFVEVENFHMKLGNIRILNLAYNNISALHGLSKLYSIVSLNVAFNRILEVEKVEAVSHLPCLEDLILLGNPVATAIDYRTKVLELFGKRSCEVTLDNETSTQKELDKVAVLQALRSAREGHLPVISLSHPLPAATSVFLETPDIASVAKE